MARWERLTNRNTICRALAAFSIVEKGSSVQRFCAFGFFLEKPASRTFCNKSSDISDLERLRNMLGTFVGSRPLKFEKISRNVDDDFVEDLKKEFSLSTFPRKFAVSVEGNIGSGKTTLLEYYKKSDFVQALREPVEQWTNIQGHNALGLLYEDPSRWSFSFNMYAQLTRVQMHTKPQTKPVKMLERSLYSTRYCFVENNYRSKTINGLEYAILTEWFEWLTKSQKAELDLIIYLRADPDVCYERIKKRSRKEETGVPKSLIHDLHDLHEDWLVRQTFGSLPAPVLVLDANNCYEKMKVLYEDNRQEILCGYV